MKKLIYFLVFSFFLPAAYAEWSVDFSRRTKNMRKADVQDNRTQKKKDSFFDFVFTSGEPIQEVVVLNTEKGFIPSTIRVKEGASYKIHIVNINEKEKNVSFILDSFSEHHATYYGKIKTVFIKPQKEGVYSFQSPETSAQGRLVVYPAKGKRFKNGTVEMRSPASAE